MFNIFYLPLSSVGFANMSLAILSVLVVVFGISVINSKNPIVSVLFLIGLFVSISVYLILLGFNYIGLSYLLVYVGAISILFLFILMLINVRVSELLNETNNGVSLATYTVFCLGYPLVFGDSILNTAKLLIIVYENIFFITKKSQDIIFEPSKNYFKGLHFEYLSKLTTMSNKDLFNSDNFTCLDLSNSDNFTCLDLSNSGNFSNLGIADLENINIIDYTTDFSDKDTITIINYDQESNSDKDILIATSNSWDNNLAPLKDITSVGNTLYSTYGIWLIVGSIILLLAMIGAITITKKEKN